MKTQFAIFILAIMTITAYGQWEEEIQTRSSKSSKKNQYEQPLKNETEYKKQSLTSSDYDMPELSEDASEALITNFDAALQRRLYAMKSTGTHSESYWELMSSYYYFLRNSYDKNLYNVVAINDQVWVEPQYITAMFDGSDPAQGVNDFITVLYKKKQLESKKDNYYNYNRNNFYWGVSLSWNMWDPWYYHWGPYYPYGPWGPYYPWGPWGPYYAFGPYYPYGPWGPWGPYHPWGPWGRTVVVVAPSHPVYYGNGLHRNIFAPSPSARKGGNIVISGDPFGRSNNYQQTKIQTPRRPNTDNRSYRNNTNTTFRNNTPSTSTPGGFGGGAGSGGGGFRNIGGGGYRR